LLLLHLLATRVHPSIGFFVFESTCITTTSSTRLYPT